MSLSQIELVWVRVRVEGDCFWVNLREENKVSEFQNVRSWIQVGRIQDSRIQDGHHHQVKWEWMSLNQIELVWVRVRVEGECFWVNLREDNQVSESKMTECQDGQLHYSWVRIQDGCQSFCANVESESEWMKFFLCKWWEPILASMSVRLRG